VPDIFISHAPEDQGAAQSYATNLTYAGWEVAALETPDVAAGLAGRDRAAAAKCVVVLWSSHSITSPQVLHDAQAARARGVLVNVRIEEVELPEDLRTLHGPLLPRSFTAMDPPAAVLFQVVAKVVPYRDRPVTSTPTPIERFMFVCYRRADTQTTATRLYKQLARVYGPAQVFRDLDNVPLGVNFARHITQKLHKCTAVLVMIGPGWISITDSAGRRRLDDPGDHVRLEIQTALALQLPLIPIVVDKASMPREAELPPDIRDLAFYNGMQLSSRAMKPGVERLIKELDRVMKP
jgi:hypothetical protein